MGKQAMGTPCHALARRIDNRLYQLPTPQTPLVRTKAYERYRIDDYALGVNAVVAVIAYTGYDMEDAMVINRASFQRGFGYGTIYKSKARGRARRGRSSAAARPALAGGGETSLAPSCPPRSSSTSPTYARGEARCRTSSARSRPARRC
jgi:hypothetical protein